MDYRNAEWITAIKEIIKNESTFEAAKQIASQLLNDQDKKVLMLIKDKEIIKKISWDLVKNQNPIIWLDCINLFSRSDTFYRSGLAKEITDSILSIFFFHSNNIESIKKAIETLVHLIIRYNERFPQSTTMFIDIDHILLRMNNYDKIDDIISSDYDLEFSIATLIISLLKTPSSKVCCIRLKELFERSLTANLNLISNENLNNFIIKNTSLKLMCEMSKFGIRFGKNIFNVSVPSQDLFETELYDFDDPFNQIFGVIKDGLMKKIIPYLKYMVFDTHYSPIIYSNIMSCLIEMYKINENVMFDITDLLLSSGYLYIYLLFSALFQEFKSKTSYFMAIMLIHSHKPKSLVNYWEGSIDDLRNFLQNEFNALSICVRDNTNIMSILAEKILSSNGILILIYFHCFNMSELTIALDPERTFILENLFKKAKLILKGGVFDNTIKLTATILLDFLFDVAETANNLFDVPHINTIKLLSNAINAEGYIFRLCNLCIQKLEYFNSKSIIALVKELKEIIMNLHEENEIKCSAMKLIFDMCLTIVENISDAKIDTKQNDFDCLKNVLKLIAVLYAFDSGKSIIILEKTYNEIDIYDDILNLVGALQYIFLIKSNLKNEIAICLSAVYQYTYKKQTYWPNLIQELCRNEILYFLIDVESSVNSDYRWKPRFIEFLKEWLLMSFKLKDFIDEDHFFDALNKILRYFKNLECLKDTCIEYYSLFESLVGRVMWFDAHKNSDCYKCSDVL